MKHEPLEPDNQYCKHCGTPMFVKEATSKPCVPCRTEDRHGEPYCLTHKCEPSDPCCNEGCPHCVEDQEIVSMSAIGLKKDLREHYKGDHKMRVNHYDVGECPSCDGRMIVVSKKPAFGKSNHACECDKCGYVENR